MTEVPQYHSLLKDQRQRIKFRAIPKQPGQTFPPNRPKWKCDLRFGSFNGSAEATGTTVIWQQRALVTSSRRGDVVITATCEPYVRKLYMTICLVCRLERIFFIGTELETGEHYPDQVYVPHVVVPIAPVVQDVPTIVKKLSGTWCIEGTDGQWWYPFKLNTRKHTNVWEAMSSQIPRWDVVFPGLPWGANSPPEPGDFIWTAQGSSLRVSLRAGVQSGEVNLLTEIPAGFPGVGTTLTVGAVRTNVVKAEILHPYGSETNPATKYALQSQVTPPLVPRWYLDWQGVAKGGVPPQDQYNLGRRAKKLPEGIEYANRFVGEIKIDQPISNENSGFLNTEWKDAGGTWLWGLDPSAGTWGMPSPQPRISMSHVAPWLAGSGRLTLRALINGRIVAADSRALRVFPSHLARDQDNFVAWARCGGAGAVLPDGTTMTGTPPCILTCGPSVIHGVTGDDKGEAQPFVDDTLLVRAAPWGWRKTIPNTPPSVDDYAQLMYEWDTILSRGSIIRFAVLEGARWAPKHWATVVVAGTASSPFTPVPPPSVEACVIWAGDANTTVFRVEGVMSYFVSVLGALPYQMGIRVYEPVYVVP